jgi:predicted Fe-Mo cluster-binding NifX family protein
VVRVAISAQQGDIVSLVDPRFGRAAWFVVADTSTGDWIKLDNRESSGGAGGGALAAKLLLRQGVRAVVSGNVGPTAQRMLDSAGVRIYQAGNGVKVRDALTALTTGDLLQLTSPTIAGPWA